MSLIVPKGALDPKTQTRTVASMNNLMRNLNRVYTQVVGKPLNRMNRSQIPQFINESLPELSRRMNVVVDNHLIQLIKLQLLEGVESAITEQEAEKILRQFRISSRYNQAFQGMEERITTKIMQNTLDNISDPNAFIDRIKEIGLSELSGIKRIVTTESLAAINWGREQNYMRRSTAETDKYFWSARFDRRTTPQCKEIARRSLKGLGLQELKGLIDEVAVRYDPNWKKRDWVPHYNCRSMLLRQVISAE